VIKIIFNYSTYIHVSQLLFIYNKVHIDGECLYVIQFVLQFEPGNKTFAKK